MQYQISFYSPQGHAKRLALSFKQLLPSLTPLIDLSKRTIRNNSIHLVGFEFSDTAIEEIPSIIENFLAGMETMEVLVFATTPLCIDEALHKQAEELILACLPPKCKFRGFFLCQGEASSTLIQELVLSHAKDHANKELRASLKMCRSSKLHPTRQDVRLGCRFVADALKLDYYR